MNIGTVSAALGHASVTITWDRYHHLMPGTMDEAASLILAYVECGSTPFYAHFLRAPTPIPLY